jgi:multicomponent Na+:H+ antiporter subunit C
MGFFILSTAINLFFFAAGAYQGDVPAYVDSSTNTVTEGQPSDPLVQALVLTAIVISFGTYAVLLGLINLASKRFKTADIDSIDKLVG